jgi:hypothetical protein
MRGEGKRSVNGQNMTLPAGSDDTIELVLTSEQLLDLSQAAEVAEVAQGAAPAPEHSVVAPAPVSVVVAPVPGPITPTFSAATQSVVKDIPASRALRWHQTPIAKMAANTLAFVAFAWWSVSQLAGQSQAHPQAPVTAAVRPIAIAHQPALVTNPPQPPVQVVNPFDKTEVFEFPAGTSGDESREKVAQILLQRARGRQSHWERIKPEVSLRTASLAAVR